MRVCNLLLYFRKAVTVDFGARVSQHVLPYPSQLTIWLWLAASLPALTLVLVPMGPPFREFRGNLSLVC